jgi:hypothetical protein
MTDITKALAFAKECLKWQHPRTEGFSWISDEVDPTRTLDLSDPLLHLEEFLGTRYFIQINRGTTSLFQWSVIVGLQDASQKGANWEHARADSDDLYDAVFDACVQAVHIFER